MIELPTRDFTVAVFVVHLDAIILHRHRKLGIWLPPGGHIEPNELPDDAALREVREETGLDVELIGERGLSVDYPGQPVQLIRPEGIQLEFIAPDHQHIDLIYFARPGDCGEHLPELIDDMRWVAADQLDALRLNAEVGDWCRKALLAAKTWP